MDQLEQSEIENLGNQLFGNDPESIAKRTINQIDDTRQANAIFLANDKTPEDHAENLTLSQQLGVRSEFVEQNKAFLKRELQAQYLNNSLSKLRTDAPKTADFLLDPDNLALSKYELQEIADIEKTVNEHSVASKAYSSLATGMGQLYSGLAKIPGGVYAIGALPQNLVARYFPETGLSEVAPPDWLLNNPIAKHYDERALEWANLNPDAQKSITSEVMSGNYKDAGKTLAYQVIQNAPTTLGLLATSWAGFPTQGLVTAGASAGSQHLDETLKQGASPTQATVAGVGSGVFESVFESLGLSKLKGWEHALEKELGRELLKSEKKAVYTSLAKTLTATALTEGTSEGATELSTRLTDYLSGAVPDFSTKEALTASADAFAVGLGSSVTTSIPSTSLVARMRIADINQAKANQKLFVDLATKSANLKLLEQSQEKHKEMLDSLTQGTNIENVSFSKEAFDGLFQTKGEEPAKAALELGIEKEYAEAEKTGADITMKTSDAITKLAKSDVVPELSNHMKFGEDPHSVHELNQTQNEMRESLETLEKQAKENQLPSFEKQIQEIRKDLQSQLEETGMPRKEAIKNAMLASETVRVDSLNMNEQPQDLWSKYKFGVTNEGIRVGGEVFYQPSDSRLNHRINVLDISTSKDPKVLNYQNFANIYKTPASDVYSNKLREINGSSFANQIIGSNKPLTVQINKLSKEIKTKNGLKYENIGPQHLAAVEYLPELLNSAEPMSRSRAKPNELNLYNTFTFNGSNYLAKFQVDLNEKKITDMRVRPIGPTPENVSTPEGSNPSDITKPLPESTRTSISISDLYDLVKSTRENIDPLFQTKTVQTDTPEFKTWFGDSKVVDENGKPLVVYHGTGSIFEEFDYSKIGQLGRSEGAGFYFTDQKRVASAYEKSGGQVMEVYLAIEKPMPIDRKGFSKSEIKKLLKNIISLESSENGLDEADTFISNFGDARTFGLERVINEAADAIANGDPAIDQLGGLVGAGVATDILNRSIKESLGYDGFVSRGYYHNQQDNNSDFNIFVAFFPTQIKSVNNRGTFDPSNPNILFQTQQNEQGFYSKLIQTVEDKMGNTQDVKSLNAMLRDIKPEERKWMGLDAFLEGKDKVSKAELLDFLRGNMIQIEEVQRGAQGRKGDNRGMVHRLFVNDNFIDAYDSVQEAESEAERYRNELGDDALINIDEVSADSYNEADDSLPTKFEDYKLPGGENYREILFTLPPVQVEIAKDKDALSLEGYGRKYSELSDAQKKYIDDDIKYSKEVKTIKFKDTYNSSHWQEKNVLAHTRLQDFTDADGKRVLMVEEIQSDWHQEGRKKGYGPQYTSKFAAYYDTPNGRVDIGFGDTKEAALENADPQWKKLVEVKVEERKTKSGDGVPDAPFKKTWHEFVFKRIARMAAEQGYDKIAWTTGEQQAERYDLSKQVDFLLYQKNEDGTFKVSAQTQGRGNMIGENITESKLEDYVGKDVAKKIVEGAGSQENIAANNEPANTWIKLEGDNLKVGGEGMKGFYDKILVDYAKKFGKKFGANVESYTLQESSSFSYYASKDGEGSGAVLYKVQGTGSIPQPIEFYDTIEQAKEAANRLNEQAQTKVHSLEVTPEMRESIMSEGLPLFQGEGDKQGAFDPDTMMIHLLQAKDKSTFIHELGHTRLFLLDKYIRDGLATPQMIKSMNEALKYVGAESFEKMTTDQHEKFARSLEAYMLEGKAPNKRLAKLFADIKAWFLDTYSKYFGNPQDHASAIKEALGVELTPEIREVFDRMFVSQNEIEKNQPKPMFADPAILQVLSEKESLEYLDAAEWARLEAEADLQAKLMKDVLRKSKADYKAKFSELQEKHLNEAKDMQVFRTMDGIKEQYKLDASVIANEFKEFKGKLPRGLTTSEDGGLRPDFVAGIYGYESATKMLEDLSNHRMGISQFVENNVLNEMKTHFPELLESPELQREAVTSAYNEGIAKMKRQELEILATKDFPTLKKVSAKLIARLPRMGDVVAEAKSLIENKSFDELKPYKYQQAEKRFSKEASKAFVKGDIEGAFEAKRMEYLNFELYREALRAQDQVSKDLKFFKKIYKADEELAKGRDTDIINAARAVLAEFGVTRSEKTASEWLSKMKAYDRGRYNSLQVLIGAATNKAGQLNEIPLGKFFEMSNAVHALWELSKIENEYKVQGETLAFDSVKDQVVAHLATLSSNPQVGVQRQATSLDKFNVALLGVKGSLTRLEPYFKALGGPMYDLVWTKIIEAQTKMQSRNEKQVKAFVEIFEPIRETLKEKKKIYAPELNYEFTGTQELLGALLHRGNESNFAKLIVGNKWGEIDEQGKLDSSRFEAFEKRMIKEGVLTKEHYQFVQNVWNLLEESKADAQKAHKRMFGYYFEEITAKPFTNEFGTFEGGYFPAVADPYKVDKASQHQEADDLLNVNNNFMFPSSNKGFTKERAANYFAPLIMDLNQVPSHLKKVSTFIELGPEVRDTARLFYSPRVQEVYRNIDQGAIPEMIIPWLQRVAQQKLPISGTGQGWRFMDNVATYLRSSTGLQTMAFNFINAMQNFTQLPSVLTRTQISSMRDALAVFIQNPKKASELMYEKSEFMRNRKGSLVMEAYDTLNDLLENPSHAHDSVNFVRQNARFMSEFSQGLVESISWLSGYKDALALGKTEEQAIKNADSVVRLTQGGFSLAEVSRFEAGSPAMRLFTIFYGFFNAVLNNNVGKATEIMRGMGLKKGASHLFFLYLVGFMVPAILNDAFGIALGGGDWDEDKDGDYADDFLKLFFGSQFNLGVAMLPFGQVAKSSVNAFNNKPYDDKISMSPAIGMVERSMQAPASLYKAIEGEGSPKKAVTDVLTLIGMLTKTPVAPIAKPINYLIDVQTGNAQSTGPIDFSRGLLTGKGKK